MVVLLISVTNLYFSWPGTVLRRKERHGLAEQNNSISRDNIQKSKVQRREKVYMLVNTDF